MAFASSSFLNRSVIGCKDINEQRLKAMPLFAKANTILRY